MVYSSGLEILIAAIENEMQPFRPGEVVVWLEDCVYRSYRVEISTLPKDPMRVPFDVLGWTYDPDRAAAEIGRVAGKYFASIREPIGDHICLGEN